MSRGAVARKTKTRLKAERKPERVGGRSARVISAVVEATLSELARVGYGALRVEDVANRAGVNKTTVYRRWPTKMALVRQAIDVERTRIHVSPDTGSLREDMRVVLRSLVEHGNTPLAYAWNAELGNEEVRAIMQDLRRPFEIDWTRIVARGMARKELPARTSPLLLLEVMVSPVVCRMMRGEALPDPQYCDQLIDLVIAGAKTVRSNPQPKSRAITGRAAIPRAR